MASIKIPTSNQTNDVNVYVRRRESQSLGEEEEEEEEEAMGEKMSNGRKWRKLRVDSFSLGQCQKGNVPPREKRKKEEEGGGGGGGGGGGFGGRLIRAGGLRTPRASLSSPCPSCGSNEQLIRLAPFPHPFPPDQCRDQGAGSRRIPFPSGEWWRCSVYPSAIYGATEEAQ